MASETCQTVAIVAKTPTSDAKGNRRKTSFVWEYFQVCEKDVRKAVCNNCGALIVRGRDARSFSTSSLASHIKYCHRSDGTAFKQMKRKRPPPSCDINVLLNQTEEEEEEQPKKRASSGQQEPTSEVIVDEEIETYVYPGEKKDFPSDVICTKRMELVHSGLMMHVLYQQHRAGKFCDLMLISAPVSGVTPKVPTPIDGILTTGVKGNKKIYHAHSSILAGVSAKLKTLIEMGSRTIELKDVSGFGLRSLLEIVYTGKLKRRTPLRFIEAYHIWKAASNLGIKYVHEYLANEHPQVAKWIADEERQSQEPEGVGDKNFVYEITSEEDRSNDLIDLCGAVPIVTEERHDYVEDFEQVHGDTSVKSQELEVYIPAREEEQQETENSAKSGQSMVEITFSKT